MQNTKKFYESNELDEQITNIPGKGVISKKKWEKSIKEIGIKNLLINLLNTQEKEENNQNKEFEKRYISYFIDETLKLFEGPEKEEFSEEIRKLKEIGKKQVLNDEDRFFLKTIKNKITLLSYEKTKNLKQNIELLLKSN